MRSIKDSEKPNLSQLVDRIIENVGRNDLTFYYDPSPKNEFALYFEYDTLLIPVCLKLSKLDPKDFNDPDLVVRTLYYNILKYEHARLLDMGSGGSDPYMEGILASKVSRIKYALDTAPKGYKQSLY